MSYNKPEALVGRIMARFIGWEDDTSFATVSVSSCKYHSLSQQVLGNRDWGDIEKGGSCLSLLQKWF